MKAAATAQTMNLDMIINKTVATTSDIVAEHMFEKIMTSTTEKIAETKRNIAETAKKIETFETFTMKDFVEVLEKIDEFRTITLTAQYDAINVFEAKQHDAHQ